MDYDIQTGKKFWWILHDKYKSIYFSTLTEVSGATIILKPSYFW